MQPHKPYPICTSVKNRTLSYGFGDQLAAIASDVFCIMNFILLVRYLLFCLLTFFRIIYKHYTRWEKEKFIFLKKTFRNYSAIGYLQLVS